jgi:hypothetical protein
MLAYPQRSDVDDFVSVCDELDSMVAQVPADWRGSVSRHQAVVQALALAAKIGPQRRKAQLLYMLRTAVLTCSACLLCQ